MTAITIASDGAYWTIRLDDGTEVAIPEALGDVCGVDGTGWECSRFKNHSGPHVACAHEEVSMRPEEVMEVWSS